MHIALVTECSLLWRRYLEQLPPTLFVTELLARSAVQMSKHYIVQCRLGFLTDRQLTKLQVSCLPWHPCASHMWPCVAMKFSALGLLPG